MFITKLRAKTTNWLNRSVRVACHRLVNAEMISYPVRGRSARNKFERANAITNLHGATFLIYPIAINYFVYRSVVTCRSLHLSSSLSILSTLVHLLQNRLQSRNVVPCLFLSHTFYFRWLFRRRRWRPTTRKVIPSNDRDLRRRLHAAKRPTRDLAWPPCNV